MDQLAAPETQRAPPTPESPSLDPARLHERAQLRQERQKQREGTADPACTFSPKVNTRARRASAEASSSPQDNRFDKLYEDAQRRRQTQETRREEAAQSREKACTFSPKVKGSRSRGPKSPDSTFQKLYEEADQRHGRRKAAQQPAPSFRPQLVAKDPRRARRDPSPFHERMHMPPDLQAKRRAALEEKKKALELEGCTFQPKLRSNSRSTSAPRVGRTAAERNEAFLKRKELRRRQREKELEEERRKHETWKPSINHGPPEIRERLDSAVAHRLEQSGKTGDVFDRLSKIGTEQDRKKTREQTLREVSADNTFKPNLNEKSRRIAEKSRSRSAPRLGGKENSLWKRLHDESERLERKKEAEKEKLAQQEMEACSFTPQVSITRKESSEATWERLLGDRASVLELREEVKAVKELDGCTFQPDLPTQSYQPRQKRTSEADVYQRLQAETEKAARQQELRQEMKQMLELEDCTFRPKLVASREPARGVGRQDSQQSVYDRLVEEAVKRKRRQERLKESVKTQELGDCTFTPAVLGLDALASSDVAARRNSETAEERIRRLASPSQRGVTNKREEIERKWAKDSEIRRSTPSRRINRSASRERQRGRASSRSGTPSNSDAQQGRRSRRSSLSRERTQKRTIRGGQARPATQANSTGQPGPATQASTTVQLSPTTQAGSTVQPSPATHASPAETEATAEQPGPELSSSTVRSEKDFAEFEATILKKLEAL